MERDAVDRVLDQWNRERPDLDVTTMGVLGRLTRASRLARADLVQFLSEFQLEPWEFDVLATLRRSASEAPLTSGRLAELTMVGSAAMTNRVDRLVHRNLIERHVNPNNRRQLLISLTEAGQTLVEEVVGRHVINQQALLMCFTSSEMETLSGLLRTFLLAHGDNVD